MIRGGGDLLNARRRGAARHPRRAGSLPALFLAAAACGFGVSKCPPAAAAEPTRRRPKGEWEIHWARLSSRPGGFRGAFIAACGPLLIAGGGTAAEAPGGLRHPVSLRRSLHVLEAPDGRWRTGSAALPAPRAWGTAVPAGGEAVLAGGIGPGGPVSEVLLVRFTGERLHIERLPPLPEPLAAAGGAANGRVVFLACGLSGPGADRASRRILRLDLDALSSGGGWEVLAEFPGGARIDPACAFADGVFYCGGGVPPDAPRDGIADHTFRDAYAFAPAGGWERLPDAPVGIRGGGTSAPLLGSATLCFLAEGKQSFTVLAFHTVTRTWRRLAEVPIPRDARGARDPLESKRRLAGWGNHLVVIDPRGTGSRLGRLPPPRSRLAALDYAALVFYFALLVWMGFHFARRERTTNRYFLAERSIPWWAAGLSIFATQLSAITFLSMPALVYRTDWVYFAGNLMIAAVAPLVVGLYLPFFRRLELASAYEYLERRFSPGLRMAGASAFLLLQLGRMGVVLYLPALALSTTSGLDLFSSIVLMGVLATLYTVLGGIEAVIWTDCLQSLVLFGGAILCLGIALASLGGDLPHAVAEALEHGKLRIADLRWDIASTALWVVIAGRFFEHLIPYTSDQTVIQRYLTTPDERAAAHSVWTNAALVFPVTLLFFTLGTALWIFFRHHPERLDPAGRNEDILAWFVAAELPPGVSGLVIAGLFAASMSSLDSSMNSMSAVIVTDFYRRIARSVRDTAALRIARASTALLGALGTGSALFLASLGDTSLWDRWTKIVATFGSGLCGLFASGLLIRRADARAAWIGFACGVAVLWIVQRSGAVHFFLYAATGILTTFVATWVASRFCGRPPPDKARFALGGERPLDHGRRGR